jgi:hypothetical protein
MNNPPSANMPSLSRQTSPAPTYTSNFSSSSTSPHWPLEEKSSTTPTDKQPQPDHLDPNHPHYIPAPPPPTPHYSTPQPSHRAWPRKSIIIPYALALLFFLTTLWFTSIALGVRFLNIMHPSPGPTVQEINVYVDGGIWEGRTTTTGSSTSSAVPSTTSVEMTSTYTGRLHLAQTGAPDIDVGLKMKGRRETGFVTIVRTM